jgi:hypothetical protein
MPYAANSTEGAGRNIHVSGVEVDHVMIQLERFYGNGTTPCLRVTCSFNTFELAAISTVFQRCRSELTTLLLYFYKD